MTSEVRELPTYEGVIGVEEFLDNFEKELPEQQRYEVMKWALNARPT